MLHGANPIDAGGLLIELGVPLAFAIEITAVVAFWLLEFLRHFGADGGFGIRRSRNPNLNDSGGYSTELQQG
jgi:hypothetical protein